MIAVTVVGTTVADSFVGSDLSRMVIAAMIAVAVLGLVAMGVVIFGHQQARIERRLAGYEVPDHAATSVKQSDVAFSAETKVVQQAVEMTRDLARRSGTLAKIEGMLEQADLPVRPAEFLFYIPTFAVISGLLIMLGAGPMPGLLAFGAVLAVPYLYLVRKRSARLKKFEQQLPDTLSLLSGSMRAGFSFMQGLEAVAEETQDPMRRELQRVFTEARLGRPPEEALEDMAARMSSPDLAWAVMAIKIQREVGGNLAELLETVAETMMQRERLRREVRALTAEGRFSAYILSAMPPGFFLMFYALQPDYMGKLFSEPLGTIAVVGGGFATVIGWFWLQKIVKIEV
jgi:tight adherence protein B